MESILLLLAPIVVTFLVQAIKKLRTIELSKNKKAWIRVIALIFSFVGIVGTSIVSGQEINPSLIEEFIKTVIVFSATQVPYVLGKKSGEKVLTGEA